MKGHDRSSQLREVSAVYSKCIQLIEFTNKIPPLIFGRPFVGRFALSYRTVVCRSVSPVLSICDVGVLRPNGWMD